MRVWVQTSWLHIFMTAVTVAAFVFYIGVRAYYLVSGKTVDLDTQSTSVPYSWVVLVAEVFLSFLGFYGHQTYWKQRTDFSKMSEEDVQQLAHVRLC